MAPRHATIRSLEKNVFAYVVLDVVEGLARPVLHLQHRHHEDINLRYKVIWLTEYFDTVICVLAWITYFSIVYLLEWDCTTKNFTLIVIYWLLVVQKKIIDLHWKIIFMNALYRYLVK